MTVGFRRVEPPGNLDSLQQVGDIPWYLAGVLSVLGLAGLGHALVTALRRRRIDLAIGRALGWTPGQSSGVLAWQALMTGLAGALVGVAVGMVIGRVLWREMAGGLDIVFAPAAPFGIAGLVLVGMTAVSVLISLPVFIRSRRLRTAQILRTD